MAGPLGLSVEEAAWGIHQIVNEVMAGAARVHTLSAAAIRGGCRSSPSVARAPCMAIASRRRSARRA